MKKLFFTLAIATLTTVGAQANTSEIDSLNGSICKAHYSDLQRAYEIIAKSKNDYNINQVSVDALSSTLAANQVSDIISENQILSDSVHAYAANINEIKVNKSHRNDQIESYLTEVSANIEDELINADLSKEGSQVKSLFVKVPSIDEALNSQDALQIEAELNDGSIILLDIKLEKEDGDEFIVVNNHQDKKGEEKYLNFMAENLNESCLDVISGEGLYADFIQVVADKAEDNRLFNLELQKLTDRAAALEEELQNLSKSQVKQD